MSEVVNFYPAYFLNLWCTTGVCPGDILGVSGCTNELGAQVDKTNLKISITHGGHLTKMHFVLLRPLHHVSLFISAVFLQVSKIDPDIRMQFLLLIQILVEVLLLLNILPPQSFLDPPYKGGCPVFLILLPQSPLTIPPVPLTSHPVQLFSRLPVD